MARVDQIRQRVRAGIRALAGLAEPIPLPSESQAADQPAAAPRHSMLDHYSKTAPNPQDTLDIFQGEWSSLLPAPYDTLRAGTVGLFFDVRIAWALEQLGGVDGLSVLELGPLEGGHSYMLEQNGAAEVIAIEANTRAFLKCLVAKELLGMSRVQFLYGDFVEYLRAAPRRFDLIVASGVLYHMRNPAELIDLLAQASDRIYLWTHYYDAERIMALPYLATKFPTSTAAEHRGFAHTLYHQEYQTDVQSSMFCGGNAEHSAWMSRDDLLACLRHFGFSDIRLAFETLDHPNGPSLAFFASR